MKNTTYASGWRKTHVAHLKMAGHVFISTVCNLLILVIEVNTVAANIYILILQLLHLSTVKSGLMVA